MDGSAADVVPVSAKIGTGRYNSGSGVLTPVIPSDTDLATIVRSGISIARTRVGREIRITYTVAPDGTARQITEAGVFTASGIALLLQSFRPRTLPASGASLTFIHTLFPEV